MGLSVRISSNDIGIWYCEGQPNSIIGGRQTLLTTLRGVKNLDRLRPMVIHHDMGVSVLPSVEISSTVSEWAAISTRRNVNKILASCNDIMDGHRAVLALAPVVDAGTRQWIHSIHQDVTDILFRLVYVGRPRSDTNLSGPCPSNGFILLCKIDLYLQGCDATQ
jgi:hypothetical protein